MKQKFKPVCDSVLYRNVGRYTKPLEISIKSTAWFHYKTIPHASFLQSVYGLCECNDTVVSIQ